MAATATAMAGFSKRNNADERDMAYIENELGKKPTKKNRARLDMSGHRYKEFYSGRKGEHGRY